ncbi:unnamed protein product [Ixodes persulcatus]
MSFCTLSRCVKSPHYYEPGQKLSSISVSRNPHFFLTMTEEQSPVSARTQ